MKTPILICPGAANDPKPAAKLEIKIVAPPPTGDWPTDSFGGDFANRQAKAISLNLILPARSNHPSGQRPGAIGLS